MSDAAIAWKTATRSLNNRSRGVAELRKSFLLFVKILVKVVGDDELVREQCKLAILKSRLERGANWRQVDGGDVSISNHPSSILQSIERELKQVVGENHWRQAKIFYGHYRLKQLQQKPRMGPQCFPTSLFHLLQEETPPPNVSMTTVPTAALRMSPKCYQQHQLAASPVTPAPLAAPLSNPLPSPANLAAAAAAEASSWNFTNEQKDDDMVVVEV